MSLNLPDTLSGVKEKLAGRLPRADRPKVPGKKGSKKKRIALAATAVAASGHFSPMSVVSLQEMTFPSASITPMVVCAASLSWSSTP